MQFAGITAEPTPVPAYVRFCAGLRFRPPARRCQGAFDAAFSNRARAELSEVAELTVPPRDAKAFEVRAGHFFRIVSIEGPQVGDLNLWNAHDLTERFYSGKTRALHATHLTTDDRL
jgi:uncharacterized protein YcgI (DUF1989 family)